jgi:hypothetical protein
MSGRKKKSKHDGAKKANGKKPDRVPSSKAPDSHVPPVTVIGVPNPNPSADPLASDEQADPTSAAKVGVLTTESARRGRLTEMVPVRFDAQMLSDVRAHAAADDRSVSSWIRRAVELELQRAR